MKIVIVSLTLTFVILLFPFVASVLSKEFNWSFFDYCISGILIFSSITIFSMITALKLTKRNRIILASIFILVILILWIELAVGIFDSPIAGN